MEGILQPFKISFIILPVAQGVGGFITSSTGFDFCSSLQDVSYSLHNAYCNICTKPFYAIQII